MTPTSSLWARPSGGEAPLGVEKGLGWNLPLPGPSTVGLLQVPDRNTPVPVLPMRVMILCSNAPPASTAACGGLLWLGPGTPSVDFVGPSLNIFCLPTL